jgi:putative flavoprotein involved in K+ transport
MLRGFTVRMTRWPGPVLAAPAAQRGHAMERTLEGLHRTVVVVGGGQAGLSMSYHLAQRGIDHIVLERERVGHEWRARRWDSFCLVTPNWQCLLPGFPYTGDDPHGFMVKDQIVDYIEAYAKSFDAPLAEGVEVRRLRSTSSGRFAVETSAGTLTADQVVAATGPYQVPLVPRMGERLPERIRQIHAADYRNPQGLPEGAVLVVGSGQSGAQIAEDLHLDGRRVHLATGNAPRVARFYRGRDVVDWLDDMGHYRRSVEDFDDPDSVRLRTNHYVTGRDGGRDIDLRAFAAAGMRLHGRMASVSGETVRFEGDLKANLDSADRVSESIKDAIDAYIAAAGLAAPVEERYTPVWEPEHEDPTVIDLAAEEVAAVVWCTGFGQDLRWIEAPVFNGRGYPVHRRGVTAVPGLYFLGLPWQWTWGSGRFSGVGADAGFLAERIADRAAATPGLEVPWIAGPPPAAPERNAEWTAPRTIA